MDVMVQDYSLNFLTMADQVTGFVAASGEITGHLSVSSAALG